MEFEAGRSKIHPIWQFQILPVNLFIGSFSGLALLHRRPHPHSMEPENDSFYL
jgi:hypothetical protein